jgi:hypothetical protein
MTPITPAPAATVPAIPLPAVTGALGAEGVGAFSADGLGAEGFVTSLAVGVFGTGASLTGTFSVVLGASLEVGAFSTFGFSPVGFGASSFLPPFLEGSFVGSGLGCSSFGRLANRPFSSLYGFSFFLLPVRALTSS